MNLSDLRTRGAKSCGPQDDLATAAALMWEGDCGSVPVLDGAGKLIGVVTDRDVCTAVATRKRLASETAVGEVMSGNRASCRTSDSVMEALRAMRKAQLRRLPILDEKGIFKGMIALGDLIPAVQNLKDKAERAELLQEIMLTLMAISQRRSPPGLQLAGVRAMVPGA